MIGNHDHLSKLVEKKIYQRLELVYNGNYEVKGIGTSSFHLESRGSVSINNILYVPRLKKNLLSISSLGDKCIRVDFMDGQVLVWKKNASFKSAKVIGVIIGGLYRLLGHSTQSLLHNATDICELWH